MVASSIWLSRVALSASGRGDRVVSFATAGERVCDLPPPTPLQVFRLGAAKSPTSSRKRRTVAPLCGHYLKAAPAGRCCHLLCRRAPGWSRRCGHLARLRRLKGAPKLLPRPRSSAKVYLFFKPRGTAAPAPDPAESAQSGKSSATRLSPRCRRRTQWTLNRRCPIDTNGSV